jgi:hypothetical protein
METEGVQTVTEDIRNLVLQVADALENPDTWCAFDMALDAAGQRLDFDSPSAVKWCAYGHACRLAGPVAASELSHAYDEHFRSSLSSDNDSHGREYVRDRLLQLANS